MNERHREYGEIMTVWGERKSVIVREQDYEDRERERESMVRETTRGMVRKPCRDMGIFKKSHT